MVRMVTVATLLIVGVSLMILETVLPGMIAGILGFFCLLAANILAYLRFGAETGNWVLFGTIIGLVVGWMIYLKYFPNSPMAKKLISQRTIGDVDAAQPNLVNQTGTALTQLRPSGTAVIGGRRVDVVTEGDLITKDTPIKVVAVEGMRVVVRPI